MRRPGLRERARLLSALEGRFAIAAVIDAFGTGCFIAGAALFFTQELGLKPSLIGIGLTAAGIVGFATTVPWGRAADRWGARRILVLLLSVRALAFVLYAFAASFAAFLAIATLLGTVEKATSPIQQALIGEAVAEDRRQRALAFVRSARNAGFALGALAAAAAVSTATSLGYDSIVLFNAASFVLAAVLMGRLPVARAAVAPRKTTLWGWRVCDRRYTALTALNGVLTMHMSLLSVGLPLWLVSHSDAPAAVIPLLLVVNAVLAVVFQVPVAGLVKSERGATAALAVAGAALALCCLAMPLASTLDATGAVLVATGAVLALTLAELAQSAGGWDLSFRLAPADRRGEHLGVFSLGTTAQSMLGPLLLTAGVFALGPWGWVALALATLAGGILATTVIDRPRRTTGRLAARRARPA